MATTRRGQLCLVVADGASTAAAADAGARVACGAVIEALGIRLWSAAPADPAEWTRLLRLAVTGARAALERSATGAPYGLREFACTLLVAVVDPGPRPGASVVAAAHVGDGAIVVRRDGKLTTVAVTPSKEYANETVFVTSSDYLDMLAVDVVGPSDGQPGPDAVALLSDGLEYMTLCAPQADPSPGFFSPALTFAADPSASAADLHAFLTGPRVSARTDDDATLVLAVDRGSLQTGTLTDGDKPAEWS